MIRTDDREGTRIPRWTPPAGPVASGRAVLRRPLPGALAQQLSTRPDAPAVLLATHLFVLHAVSGEPDVVTGLRAQDSPASAHHAQVTAAGPWAELVAEAARAASSPLEAPAPQTRLVLGRPGTEDEDTELTVGVSTELVLSYRHDVMTADQAERLAGYFVTVLERIAGAPDTDRRSASLLSAEETDFQLTRLGGPRRPLPEKNFVQIFEDHVRARGDATAATHGERRWSYAELDRRANQLARALLAAGLRDEDVVAVVMDRTLDWLAATLAVLKAGGGYLPVRPDFPAARVADQLRRSRCRLILTEAAGAQATAAAVTELVDHPEAGDPLMTTIRVEDAYAVPGRVAAPNRPAAPGQLAYIYFTSGSTGRPKGAMCEHAGLLNHLYAKVDDMELAAGDVVTQTASQCFDISLWQLLAPLLVGGSTAIVDTATQLDVERFVDLVAGGGIHVVQIVPAYLDVVLTNLERRPRPLGDLRSVSVTGEALRSSLVKRWFALHPQIRLVNAYGATEVSDDTMHAVLCAPPERDLAIVNVGHSLRNVDTYIVDDDLRLVPLGAPGEIVFSGVAVGRGYINDPERTAQAFTTDPFRPGARLYRTGDYGRWLPEGTIEFLGRRDEQVKVRGFRIEIGEIENRLLQVPGVSETAVIIQGAGDATKNLAAFYTGSDSLQTADLHDFLAAALPDYMVPSYFHRVEELPYTENGKTNKKLLGAWAQELGHDRAAYQPPATDTERKLATAWAEVLNVLVGRISRDDDFFRLGGTSLAAVRLLVKLDRAVSLRDLIAHRVLRDLATRLDEAERPARDELLQQLAVPEPTPRATLICFPYAGGNSVNFQLLATELAGTGIAVSAAELPGHDISRPGEALTDVAEVTRRALEELPDGPILVWGHCAGGAYALELARKLQEQGRPAERVFIGAWLLAEPAQLRGESTEVSALSNREITDRLREDRAYVELDLLRTERSELVGRAYRHDVTVTNDYLLERLGLAGAEPLTTPVEVVVAADDPTTPDAGRRYKFWEQLAVEVSLQTLDTGGHHFARTRAAEVAALVAARCPAVR